MKILAVSDRVMDNLYHSDVRRSYNDVDLMIGCGDLPYYYLNFLASAMDAPMVYVLGNHDGGEQHTSDGRILTTVQGGTNIHARTIREKGLIIAGLEGSMRYRPHAPLMYSEREMQQQVARLIPRLLWNKQRYGRYLDILVTHSPPFGIHDRQDVPHTGFKVLLSFMKTFRPRYLLHGHIHIYRNDVPRETQFEDTTIINVYPYRVIDCECGPTID